jgi:hypothetical protein
MNHTNFKPPDDVTSPATVGAFFACRRLAVTDLCSLPVIAVLALVEVVDVVNMVGDRLPVPPSTLPLLLPGGGWCMLSCDVVAETG